MAKSLNEMATNLKDLINDMNSDAHNSKTYDSGKYNNLKVIMDPERDPIPHVVICIGISEAKYNLNSFERVKGSLGPDEKYVQRWFNRTGVVDNLKDFWKMAKEGIVKRNPDGSVAKLQRTEDEDS